MKVLWLAGAMAFAIVVQAHAAETDLPPIPDRPEAELFKDVPAPWRDYLLKARAAEQISDPMRRCLTYPDLPGNKWPQGHAEAHCLSHALLTLPADKFNKSLDEGRYDELEGQLDALLARHFEQKVFSEEIDYVFDAFTAVTPQVDARTQAWLAARPKSAYAHLARGIHLLEAGIDARGGNFIAETPRSQLQKMAELFAQAVPELEQAARMQPKLMPAHAWLVVAAMYDSDSTSKAAAVAAAGKFDPACQTMFMRRMNALRPRWGGSYDELLSLAGEVSQYVAQRPQLAVYQGRPYAYRGEMMIFDKQLDRETAEMLDIAVGIGSDEMALNDAANVAFNAKDGSANEWKALAYLLQEARFRYGDRWANTNIARMFVRRDPAWALRYATRAVTNEPDNAGAQFYLAASNYNTKRFDEAEKHYLLAIADADYRKDALDDLIRMWMFDAGLPKPQAAAKAMPHIERLIREFPEDGRARMYRIESGLFQGRINIEWIKDFMTRMDPNDRMQASYKRYLDDRLEKSPEMREMMKRTPAPARR